MTEDYWRMRNFIQQDCEEKNVCNVLGCGVIECELLGHSLPSDAQ